MVEHDDAIGIENGVDPMSDRNDGTILEHTTSQRCLQESIRLDVNGGLHRLALVIWHLSLFSNLQ